jgi:hypothetical protein
MGIARLRGIIAATTDHSLSGVLRWVTVVADIHSLSDYNTAELLILESFKRAAT